MGVWEKVCFSHRIEYAVNAFQLVVFPPNGTGVVHDFVNSILFHDATIARFRSGSNPAPDILRKLQSKSVGRPRISENQYALARFQLQSLEECDTRDVSPCVLLHPRSEKAQRW